MGGTKEAQEASSLTVSFYIPLCFVGSTFCFDAPSHDFSNAKIFLSVSSHPQIVPPSKEAHLQKIVTLRGSLGT